MGHNKVYKCHICFKTKFFLADSGHRETKKVGYCVQRITKHGGSPQSFYHHRFIHFLFSLGMKKLEPTDEHI